ncbi:MAG: tail fiber protein [Rhodocyclaceae bacterium]|nr:tail fiber protein [Rhodocyclaceae bacterium]
MSQATAWGVPSSAPATPTEMAGRMNSSLDALLSGHSGTARPPYAVAGTVWVDTSSGTWVLNLYDGSTDIPLMDINPTTHTTAAVSQAGVISAYAGDVIPARHLVCDGSLVSRTAYARLFAAIQTRYGAGDGSTTFGLPDGRGRVLVSLDAGAGVLAAGWANTLGGAGGSETHTLVEGELAPHYHDKIQDTGASSATVYAYDGTYGAGGLGGRLGRVDFSGNEGQLRTSTAGGGSPHNNVQPSLAIQWIISY